MLRGGIFKQIKVEEQRVKQGCNIAPVFQRFQKILLHPNNICSVVQKIKWKQKKNARVKKVLELT